MEKFKAKPAALRLCSTSHWTYLEPRFVLCKSSQLEHSANNMETRMALSLERFLIYFKPFCSTERAKYKIVESDTPHYFLTLRRDTPLAEALRHSLKNVT